MSQQSNAARSHLALEEVSELSFEELSAACPVTPEFIHELITYSIIEPKDSAPGNWRFTSEELRIIRIAVRLHQDLEVNHAGIAVAVDLLDEIEELRRQLDLLEKYFSAISK